MLVTIAEELYALPPADFTSARNQRAKDAKASGDPELAREIGRLPKPSVAAWAVNLLVRERPDIVAGVIDLGNALRDAQEDLDRQKLTALNRQRQDLLRAVAAEGAALAEDAGHRLPAAASADVEQTLQAAMADPSAAVAVRSGRLVRALSSTGVEAVDLTDALGGPAVSAGPAPRAPQRQTAPTVNLEDRRRLKEAKREAEETEKQAERARRNLASAEGRLKEIVPQRDRLDSAVAELERRLAETEKQLAEVEREAAQAERDRADALLTATEAERAARDARRKLERLTR